MTKVKDLNTLVDAGQATIAVSRNDVLEAVAQAFERRAGQKFAAIPDIEGRDDDELAAMSTAGTVLAPVVSAMNAAGVPTQDNVGSVMRGLQTDRHEMHDAFCHCISTEVSAEQGAARVRRMKKQ